MVNSRLGKHHLNYVSYHVNQTFLVDELLKNELIEHEDIHCPHEDTEVYQWLVFNNFRQYDYEQLEKADIPFIDSNL